MEPSATLRVVVSTIQVLIFLGFLATLAYCFQYIVQFRIVDKTLRIQLFGLITVRRINLREVEDVRVITLAQMFPFSKGFKAEYFFAEKWVSYHFSSRVVFVKKRKGVLGRFILRVKHPEQFVEQILQVMAENSPGGAGDAAGPAPASPK